ncbi:MAG: hypothetical protein HC921_02345 [Synechococcaceae cyanobacterium SM2_3_1]|nr:hypothetical protein [Synechococcaceae cyanobacterium SM2_3_1]
MTPEQIQAAFATQLRVNEQIQQSLAEERRLLSDLRLTQAQGDAKLDRLAGIVERFIDVSTQRFSELEQQHRDHEQRILKQEQISEKLEMLLENLLRQPPAGEN